MKNKIENYQSILMEHYLVVLLLLSLIALTIAGIGSRRMVGLIGCVLCAVAITKGPVKIDLWIIGPMVIYEIFNGLSSLRIYGDVFHGFFNTQIIFPVVYVLVAYLSDQERLWLHRLCALWAGFVSIYGIFQFTHLALTGTISRSEAFLGNPNALGSFLIVAWFAAKESEPDGSEKGILVEILRAGNPYRSGADAVDGELSFHGGRSPCTPDSEKPQLHMERVGCLHPTYGCKRDSRDWAWHPFIFYGRNDRYCVDQRVYYTLFIFPGALLARIRSFSFCF